MKFNNLNSSEISFPQDALIHFEESTHTYTIDGLGSAIPVSTVISKFFMPFDAEYWSLKKCSGNLEQAEELRETWKAKGELASQAGTHLHKQIEIFLNTGKEAELTCQIHYDGKYIHLHKNVDISQEWKYFKNFHNKISYTPFRTEWCIFDIDTHMAGTVDLICSCQDGTYEMFDWKRSNNINPDELNKWSAGINGLEHITDTAYSHYCLQQNLYRYMLEKNYAIHISKMHLVVLHPQKSDYEVIPIKRMDGEVGIIVNYLKQTVRQ